MDALDPYPCYEQLRKYRNLLFLKYSYIYEDRTRDSDAELIEEAIRRIDAVSVC